MIWIALAIIFVGFLLFQALERHNKEIEAFKLKELEANPEYRKQKHLKGRISTSKMLLEDSLTMVRESQQRLRDAQATNDKKAIEHRSKQVLEAEKLYEETRNEYQKLMDELTGVKN